MKSKIVIILLGVCAVAVVAAAVLFIMFSPNRSREISFANELELSNGKTIQARTRVGDLGVQKGDVFAYYFETWYDSRQVSEIDKANLDKNVNLHPFEIKNVKEQELYLGGSLRLYQREYTLQLVTGNAGQLYEFPEVIVRYKPKGSDGLLTTSFSPEPVFVASRLTTEVRDLVFGYGPLRPIAATIEMGSQHLPWVFWTLGGLLAVLGVFSHIRGIVRQRPGTTNEKRKPTQGGVVFETYRSLTENMARAVSPRCLLHQMDHVLRILLVQQEKIDWLSELNPGMLPLEIRKPAASLIAICRRAYSPKEEVEARDVEEGLQQLDDVLGFYFGQEELAAWRDLQSL